jgi:hypothetical protein
MSILDTDTVPVVRGFFVRVRRALARSDAPYSPALCLTLLLTVGIAVKFMH